MVKYDARPVSEAALAVLKRALTIRRNQRSGCQEAGCRGDKAVDSGHPQHLALKLTLLDMTMELMCVEFEKIVE